MSFLLPKRLENEDYCRATTDVGDAILSVTTDKSSNNFLVQIYEERNVKIRDSVTKEYRDMIQRVTPYSMEACDFVPSRFKHGYKDDSKVDHFHLRYKVPITDFSVNLITKAWTGKKIISDLAKPLFQHILVRELKAEQNAKRAALFNKWLEDNEKEFTTNPDLVPPDSVVPTSPWFEKYKQHLAKRGLELQDEPFEMKAYQQVAAFCACATDAYALFEDPGLGKTLQMICKLDYIIDNSQYEYERKQYLAGKLPKISANKTMSLILCPKGVRTNWEHELEKFSMHYDNILIIQLDGNSPNDRIVKFSQRMAEGIMHEDGTFKHIVIIANYESFVKTTKFHNFEYDLCLLDESDNIANYGIKRTKKLLEIRSIFKNRIIATGTAIRNTPFDLFAQFEFLGEGYSGFDSLEQFKRFFGLYGYNPNTGRAVLTDFQNLPMLREKIAKHCFVGKREKLLPFMPKRTEAIISCTMSHEQALAYKQMAEEMMTVIDNYQKEHPDEPEAMSVQNILTQMLRLEQITSGFARLDNGEIYRFDPNPKLELLTEMLVGSTKMNQGLGNGKDEESEDYYEGILTDPNSKFIVWCCYKENLRQIQARLALEGIQTVLYHGELKDEEKEASKNNFNCVPEIRGLIGTAGAGGVGLNLVGFDPYNPGRFKTNCNTIFNYSYDWSSRKRVQANDRNYRLITRVPVQIWDMVVPRSIDREIYDRVKGKIKMADSLQNVRDILTKLISVEPMVNGD